MTDLQFLDFRCCGNPLGTSPKVSAALNDALSSDGAFDPEFEELREFIGRRHGVHAPQVILSGSEGELTALLAATSGAKKALLPTPCPEGYERALNLAKISAVALPMSPRRGFRLRAGELGEALRDCDLLVMGNPSWPGGGLISPSDLLAELDDWLYDGGRLILDERAIDFTYGSVANSVWSALRNNPRVALLRSLTAMLGLSLCPLCYAVGGTGWISAARRRQFSPPVSPLVQSLTPFLENLNGIRSLSFDRMTHIKSKFVDRLRRISGVRAQPGDANWILCRLERDDISTAELANLLRQENIIIQTCENYFPLTVRAPIETDRLIKAMRRILIKR